jgi:alpha,alpha-trehalase
MVTIDLERFEAFIFDLDGVITQTASIHARAWKQLFDVSFSPDKRRRQALRSCLSTSKKPRIAGVLSFLAARSIKMGELDPTEQDRAHALARRKDFYFPKNSGAGGCASI